jgi:uncharacterized membrane protein YphA (DoxX/SURF4 family)
MKATPLSDVIEFLTQPTWTTVIYWLLILGSIAIAAYAAATIPAQRSWRNVSDWLLRFVIGSMWWQQTLWKLPPYYTDHPEDPTGTGLYYWMTTLGKSAPIQLQADFVNKVVLPHFYLFAPFVYAAEVLTAVSLILGIFVRFWGVIGALQILNLWLGLYHAEGEWPWTYFFLLVLQVIFAVHQYGRSLGLDAIIVDRDARSGERRRVLEALT